MFCKSCKKEFQNDPKIIQVIMKDDNNNEIAICLTCLANLNDLLYEFIKKTSNILN